MGYLGTAPGKQVITTTQLADGVVTSPKIADNAVITQDIADSAVTTAKVANNAITPAKLSSQAQFIGFKNRIINGAMVIDQRNAGASVTPTTIGATYTLDRWAAINAQSSKYSVQQSTVVPSGQGFSNSLLATSLSAYSVLSTDYFYLTQYVEGFNAADLMWGTANAKTVTVSFWVRSSLTGTFVMAVRSGGDDAAYPATYTISAANTWEQKTITIAGPTTGTFNTTNGKAFGLWFSLGAGSTFNGTANTWAGGGALSVSGAQSVVGTNGATFYITGVQLEVGSTATSFDYRPYGTELALCKRYYERSDGLTQVVGGSTGFGGNTYGSFTTYEVQKRANPTMTFADVAGNAGKMTWWQGATQYNNQNLGPETFNTKGFSADTTGGRTDAGLGRFSWTASAEL